ncbi:MAG TPA: hypothetical protein PKX48_14395 [Planctomycetota bacterium]|jgi:hypothetical protein|nr:hypothetical protein [Planctomycetota bacterium]NMD34795.1 hypothetical protein [Planctomycetota bacterium]HOE31259.1 hypothetical protein [Planctomycetota bacterium]HOE88195.1 hypothetical protein [Planctomycetota bacterium]HOR68861.1 hypothetical protein [Planctomycetota bacterium]
MKVRTAEAAKKLGLSVPAFLDAAAGLMEDLQEAWPKVDNDYVETIQKLYRLDVKEQESEKTQTTPIHRAGPPSLSQVDRAKLRILDKLERADKWGGNVVSFVVLRNHYCKGLEGFDEALRILLDDDLVTVREKSNKRRGPFSLNPAKKRVIKEALAQMQG